MNYKNVDVKNIGLEVEQAPKFYLLLVPVFVILAYVGMVGLFSI